MPLNIWVTVICSAKLHFYNKKPGLLFSKPGCQLAKSKCYYLPIVYCPLI